MLIKPHPLGKNLVKFCQYQCNNLIKLEYPSFTEGSKIDIMKYMFSSKEWGASLYMRSNICRLFVILCLIGHVYMCNSQTIIQLEKDGGVYKVPCVVNGLRLKLIFDTGASNVCISQTVASMMLENDYLSVNDILGTSKTQVADGRIVGNTRINLKKIQIGDKVLTNVEAVVIHGQTAPLLLGQSALKRLGRYSISGDKLVFGIDTPKTTLDKDRNKRALYKVLIEYYDMGTFEQFARDVEDGVKRRKLYDAIKDKCLPSGISNFDEFTSYLLGEYLSDDEIDQLFKDAQEARNAKTYHVALEKYNILNDNGLLNAYGKMSLADCYYFTENYEKARNIYMSILPEIESDISADEYDLANLYFNIGRCLSNMEDYAAAIPYLEKAKLKTSPYSSMQSIAVYFLSRCFEGKGDVYRATAIIDDYISQYLSHKRMRATDCWDKGYRDKFLAELYYNRYLCASSGEIEKYLVIAAAWGYEDAIEECNKYMIEFRVKPREYIYK